MTTILKMGGADYAAADYTLPVERTFRDAWGANADTGIIHVDMPMAKNIWRDKIRLARIEALSKLDKDFMRALEAGADTAQVVADKQALRDAPALASIDAATTPDELIVIQPIPNVIIV